MVFLFYKGLSQNYEISKNLENDVSKELKKYKICKQKSMIWKSHGMN